MPHRHPGRDARLPGSNHFHGNIIAALLARAVELDVCSAPWFDGLRIGPADFDAPEPPCLSYRDVCSILRRALASLPGEGHGLELGNRQSLSNFGVLGLAMLAASTFREALHTGIRYAPISGAMLDLALADDPAGIAMTMRMYRADPQLEIYLCEELASSCLNLCRSVLGEDFRPERIELAYPPPAHAERYPRVLRAEVRFGCTDNRIVVARRWLDQPMPAANPKTAHQLAELCRAQMPPGQPASGIVAVIEQRLALQPAKAPQLAELALELHMTERTLRRQLQAEGASYRALLDRVRERAARRLLHERALSLGQVAAAVGFSDVRDFRRAFKRWTGRLPGELRRDEAAVAVAQPSTITPSTSNAAPLGSADASMVERAG